MEMPEKAKSSLETAQGMANGQNDNDLIGKINEQLNQL